MEFYTGVLQTLCNNICWGPPKKETALQKKPQGAGGHQDEHEP